MKKTLFFVMILAVMAVSCKKSDSNSKELNKELNYHDSDPIVMALSGNENPQHQFDHKIQVTSDYDITYTAINPDTLSVILVSRDGYLHGRNVGTAKVKMDNGFENRMVDVIVKLFIEPTFDFGCNSSKIRELYGSPFASAYIQDTILVYQYTASAGYSYAGGEMDFYFNNGEYYLSSVYIKPTVDLMLDRYLTENFNLDTIYGDTLSIFRYKEDNSIRCEGSLTHNQWNEFLLVYYKKN